MTNSLKSPDDYIPTLEALRKRNRYALPWVMRIMKKTNRHVATDGTSWGWYEIWPLGITVGYWGSSRDDLRNVDITAWNARAADISKGD